MCTLVSVAGLGLSHSPETGTEEEIVFDFKSTQARV